MYFDWMDVSRRTAHARCTKWGSNGGRSGCIPASSGSRLPFRVLQLEHAVSTLFHPFVPPRDRGTRWSRVRHSRWRSSCWLRPQNWQRKLSRAKRKVLVTWRRNRRGTWTNTFLFAREDRKSTRLNSSHDSNSYAVFFLK